MPAAYDQMYISKVAPVSGRNLHSNATRRRADPPLLLDCVSARACERGAAVWTHVQLQLCQPSRGLIAAELWDV